MPDVPDPVLPLRVATLVLQRVAAGAVEIVIETVIVVIVLVTVIVIIVLVPDPVLDQDRVLGPVLVADVAIRIVEAAAGIVPDLVLDPPVGIGGPIGALPNIPVESIPRLASMLLLGLPTLRIAPSVPLSHQPLQCTILPPQLLPGLVMTPTRCPLPCIQPALLRPLWIMSVVILLQLLPCLPDLVRLPIVESKAHPP